MVPLKILVKKLSNERFELCGRIGLLKEAPAGNEPPGHIGSKRASGGVQHPQLWPDTNRLIGYVIAAERQCMKAYIDEKDIDMVRGREVQKRASKVARQQRVVAQAFNQQLGVQANKYIVFYDKNDGHQKDVWRGFGIAIQPSAPHDPFRRSTHNSRRRERFQR